MRLDKFVIRVSALLLTFRFQWHLGLVCLKSDGKSWIHRIFRYTAK